jgi:hypothetical protein
LAADRVEAPSAVEQEGAAGERSDLFAGGRLGGEEGGDGEEGEGQGDAIFQGAWKRCHWQLSL